MEQNLACRTLLRIANVHYYDFTQISTLTSILDRLDKEGYQEVYSDGYYHHYTNPLKEDTNSNTLMFFSEEGKYFGHLFQV